MSVETTLNLTMRPSSFDDVIGLREQVNTIKNKIAEGVPRGFLIKGPYGCGKTTLSLIIAKEIQGWDFSGKPQVQEINGANYRKIDDMRRLAESAGNYPMVGKYNVIVIDEAQQLTKEAQQILLKELEVPKAPTVWIIATTDPEKINQGVRDRCFTITVQGMGSEERAELVKRAATEVGHVGDITEFITALEKAKIVSPRKILMAFELYHNGTSAAEAVSSMSYDTAPEVYDLALGVVYGQWFTGYTLPFIKDKDGSPKKFTAVCEQLHKLDERLKKKKGVASENDAADVISDNDTESVTPLDGEDLIAGDKLEVSRDLRTAVAGLLKNCIAKEAKKFTGSWGESGKAKAAKAADALFILSHCISPNPFDTASEWAATIGGLYRVNAKIQGK